MSNLSPTTPADHFNFELPDLDDLGTHVIHKLDTETLFIDAPEEMQQAFIMMMGSTQDKSLLGSVMAVTFTIAARRDKFTFHECYQAFFDCLGSKYKGTMGVTPQMVIAYIMERRGKLQGETIIVNYQEMLRLIQDKRNNLSHADFTVTDQKDPNDPEGRAKLFSYQKYN